MRRLTAGMLLLALMLDVIVRTQPAFAQVQVATLPSAAPVSPPTAPVSPYGVVRTVEQAEPEFRPVPPQPQPKPQPEPLPPPRPQIKDNGNDGTGNLTAPPLPSPLPPIGGAPPEDGPTMPLYLPEVLNSVELHYPLLRAVEQDRAIAGGQLLSAMGAFDLNFKMTDTYNTGTFNNNYIDARFDQAFTNTGLTVFSGYRNGLDRSEFPVYYGYYKTADGGEYRAGATLPLLRDSVIDRRRATLQQARINIDAVEGAVERQRIDFLRAAARTYWIWVAAGKRVGISRELLRVARERDDELAERVEKGITSAFERADNQRTIAERQARLVVAERVFQKATIDLSLFLRDPQGMPILASTARLPDFPKLQPIDASQFPPSVEIALAQRPELRRLRALRERALVELRFAQNQTLPAVNAFVFGAKDAGFYNREKDEKKPKPEQLDANTLQAGLTVDVPLQRRDARGRVLAAQAQVAQLSAQERFAQDAIIAEVQDTISALERAYTLHDQVRLGAELAQMVEEGEAVNVREGRSNILTLNLRELATFDARLGVVDAMLEYFRSLADYEAALGFGREPIDPAKRR